MVTKDGAPVGRLEDVLATAANDVFVVRSEEGREILVPAVRHVVLSIDPEEGTIVIDPIPGLLEE